MFVLRLLLCCCKLKHLQHVLNVWHKLAENVIVLVFMTYNRNKVRHNLPALFEARSLFFMLFVIYILSGKPWCSIYSEECF